MKIILFHGSPHSFDNFTIQGLKNNDSAMAVTAGYYFTTSLQEAMTYIVNKKEALENEKKQGFVYRVDLENLDFEYKAGKDSQCVHENGIILDLNNIEEKHFTIKTSNIERIIKKLPKADLIDKINNYYDFYDPKFGSTSERDKINYLVKKIAHQYMSLFKEDFLHGFNVLGNDFFNNSNEEIALYNNTFSRMFNIMAFSIEREFNGKPEKHYIFLDKDRIPSIIKYHAHEVEIKMAQEQEKLKQAEIAKAKQKEDDEKKKIASFRKMKKDRMTILLRSLRNKIKRNKKNGKKHDHQSIKSEYENDLSKGKQILFGFKEKHNVYDFVYELNDSIKEQNSVYNESTVKRIEDSIFDIYDLMRAKFFDSNLSLITEDNLEPEKHQWHHYVQNNIQDVVKTVLMADLGYRIDEKLETEYNFDLKRTNNSI